MINENKKAAPRSKSPLSGLPLIAKVLYADVAALAQKSGVCYATNEYFAERYGVSSRTVAKYVGLLSKKNAIEIGRSPLKFGGMRVIRPKKQADNTIIPPSVPGLPTA